MKKTLPIIVLAFFGATSAFAQAGEPEEKLLGGTIGGDTRNYLLQNMTPKEIATLQSKRPDGNVNTIIQTGNGHHALIQQVGIGNVTDITQKGTGNVYQSTVTGNDNINIINQNGNQNTLIQELRTDSHVYRITQQGSGNQLRQTETGTIQSVPVEITQRGQGMQVTITNGSVVR